MFSHKLKPGQTQGAADALFGKDAAKPWTERTGAEEGVTPPPPASDATGAAEKEHEEEPLERKSYRILRGRIISLPSLRLTNRQGQIRVFPWSYFGGASMDHPGELQLVFDGPDGSSTITVCGKALDVELLPWIERNRVEWIQELDDLAAAGVEQKDPNAPVVTGLVIRGGAREWTRSATVAKGGRQP